MGERWEAVAGEPGPADYTDRLKVEGGWLYRTRVHEGVSLTFVPGQSRIPAKKDSRPPGV
jgi:hypothetical protein